MYSLDEVADNIIRNISNASINIKTIKEDLFKSLTEQTKPNEDIEATLFYLKKAIHIAELIFNKSKFVTIYDLKTAQEINFVDGDVKIPCIYFKLPEVPLCYVNIGILKFLMAVTHKFPDISYRIRFRDNYRFDNCLTVVSFKANRRLYAIAKEHHVKVRNFKNLTLCYL